jgi:hypothetical protein
VAVPMMEIRAVRVVVLQRLVVVRMGVRPNDRRIMPVIVMPVIMRMGVLVVELLVAVPVMVLLGHVQVGGRAEQHACQANQLDATPVAEREGYDRSQKGSQCEERARPSCAESALRS